MNYRSPHLQDTVSFNSNQCSITLIPTTYCINEAINSSDANICPFCLHITGLSATFSHRIVDVNRPQLGIRFIQATDNINQTYITNAAIANIIQD